MSSPACHNTRDIASLIPQRAPIMMVESFTYEDAQQCRSALAIASDNIFVDETGRMAEEGILEHIAQTAAAYVGKRRLDAGEEVNMGYIGDIKRCVISAPMPVVGDVLRTKMQIVSQVGNITMIAAETIVGGRTVVTCRMKLAN